MKKMTLVPLVFFCFFFLFIPVKIIQSVSILIILLYLWAFFLSRFLYYSVSVQRDKQKYYCINGSHESTSLTLQNKGFFPLDNIILHDKGSGCYKGSAGVFMDRLQGRSCKTFSSELFTGKRGRHKIGPIVIKGSDPFHFFPWTKTFFQYADVFIYPEYHPFQLLLKEGEIGGHQKIKDPLYEDKTDLKAIREFRRGDSLKKINWKASAKAGTLQTMEYSQTLSTPVLVLMDITPEDYPLKYRYMHIERTIEAAASLITSFGGKGETCSLLVKGAHKDIYIPPGKGSGHIISILEELAELSFSKDSSNNTIITKVYEKEINPVAGTHIYILVPEIKDVLQREMALLRKKKYSLNLVMTGGASTKEVPGNCEYFTLSNYGRRYFDG